MPKYTFTYNYIKALFKIFIFIVSLFKPLLWTIRPCLVVTLFFRGTNRDGLHNGRVLRLEGEGAGDEPDQHTVQAPHEEGQLLQPYHQVYILII